MLKAEQVEEAFIETARQQDGGPFNWERLTALINERLADQRAEVGEDGPASKKSRVFEWQK